MFRKRSREDADLPEDPEQDLPLGTQESSLFELQVDELLNEARVDYVRADDVDAAIDKLGAFLRNLPEGSIRSSDAEVSKFLECMGMPQRALRFAPPERVYPVGSWAAKTMAQPNRTVDIALQMPASCVDEKDQLNGRYFARRVQYLAEVAAELRQAPEFRDISWNILQHDARRPVLIITLQKASSQAFALRLIPVLPKGRFPLAKLTPERNNLRPSTGAAPPNQAANAQPLEAPLPPTPLYNAAILQDMMVGVQQEALLAAVREQPYLTDAIILLKLWARTQGIAEQPDSMSGFLLSMLAAHLAASGSLMHAMKPLQIMRAVLNALQQPTLFSKGVAMQRHPAGSAAANPPSLGAFRRHHEAVFVDANGYLNLAARLSRSALAEVQSAARRGLKLLDQPADPEAAFAELFLTRRSPTLMYDAFWRVSVPVDPTASQQAPDQLPPRHMETKVEQIAQQALGTRARLLRAFRRPVLGGPQLDAASSAPSTVTILLAAQLDTAVALRAVDVGPPAESPKAAAFRDFWGPRAELRRFKDGSIAESVVWQCGPSERHLIVDHVTTYALKRHLGTACTVSGHAGLLDATMRQKGIHPDEQATARREIEAAIAKLGKQLRSASSLPLKVVAVQPLSAAARHTAPFPPLPHPLAGGPHADPPSRLARCLDTIDLLAQLEGSGKWPDHPRAYAKAKAAMGCQLADELASGFGLHASASEHCIDVLADGFAFRIFLASERDSAMASAEAEGGGEALTAPEAALARAAQHAVLRRRARHHAMLAALSGSAPAFPAAARLVSCWLAAHMLSNHITEPTAELLTAAVFSVDQSPLPGSQMGGFLQFLHLLSTHPWRERALVVDPNAELAGADREAALALHSRARREGTVPAMCIIPAYAPEDPLGEHLSASVVHRASALARRSLSALKEHIEHGLLSAEALQAMVFTPALGDFDALLQLSRDALAALPCAALGRKAQRAAAEQCGFSPAAFPAPAEAPGDSSKRSRAMLRALPEGLLKKRKPASLARELLLGFEPVQLYLASLQSRFGDMATICAGFQGSAMVGIKWRSMVQQPHELNLKTAHAASPAWAATPDSVAGSKSAARKRSTQNGVAAPGKVALDTAFCLAEMYAMGAGLVEEVLRKD